MIAKVLPFPLQSGPSPFADLQARHAEALASLQRSEQRAALAEEHLRTTRRELARLEDRFLRHRQRRRPLLERTARASLLLLTGLAAGALL